MASEKTVRQICESCFWFGDLELLKIDILAAYDREIGVMRRELAAKDAQIARLTAALKPVLDCVFVYEPGFGIKKSKMRPCFNGVKVVKECQSIFVSWEEDNGHSRPGEGSQEDRAASGSDCELRPTEERRGEVMEDKVYTALEMRELADRIWDYETMSKGLELCDNDLEQVDCEATYDLIRMLRQAADKMECKGRWKKRYEYKGVVLEKSGKIIKWESQSVFEKYRDALEDAMVTGPSEGIPTVCSREVGMWREVFCEA